MAQTLDAMEVRRQRWRDHMMGTAERQELKRQLYARYIVHRTDIHPEILGLIQRDIPRTFPRQPWVCQHADTITRLLVQYAAVHRGDGYLQGFNFAMAIMWRVFEGQPHAEADTWWCFARYVGLVRPCIPDFNVTWYHSCRRRFLGELLYRLRRKRPVLHSILVPTAEHFSTVVTCKWLLIWFAQQVSFEDIFVLWDLLVETHPTKLFQCYTLILYQVFMAAAPDLTYQWSKNPTAFMGPLLGLKIQNVSELVAAVRNAL
jgi:hypothetical protein